MEKNVWVTITIELSDSEFLFNSKKRGLAELKFNTPLRILENLDPGDMFRALILAAIEEYTKPKDEDKESE